MVAFGPSYSTVVSAGRLGRLQGESPAEAADRAARENQAQRLNTQKIEDNELRLRKMRDLERYRSGQNVVAANSGGIQPSSVGTDYTGALKRNVYANNDPAAVQAGINYTRTNYEQEAFGTPTVATDLADGTATAPTTTDAKVTSKTTTPETVVQNLAPVWANLEKRYGLPEGYLESTARVESSLDPNAQNPNSSAGGLFQFLDATAAEFGLTNKFDAVASSNAAAKLAARNAKSLAAVLGRQPTAGELYLAHQQGATGAAKLLDPANSDVLATSVVNDPQFILLNGGNERMTAGQFTRMWLATRWTGSTATGTGQKDFSVASPNELPGGLQVTASSIVDKAMASGARPGSNAAIELPTFPSGTEGDGFVPVTLNEGTTAAAVFDYNPRTGEVRPRGANAEILFGGSDAGRANIQSQIFNKYSLGAKVAPYQDAQQSVAELTKKAALLRTQVDNASAEEYAAKLQEYRDTLAQIETAKNQVQTTNAEVPGPYRNVGDVFTNEGPEAGITRKQELDNLKKIEADKKAREEALKLANSGGTDEEKKKTLDIVLKTAGLNVNPQKNDGTIKVNASVYSLDPEKYRLAEAAIASANETIKTLARAQALHRLAGNISAELEAEQNITTIKAKMEATRGYLKGMGILREVKKGDLMPFVNLMANTFKTNDIELRESDGAGGRWTLFVNGVENPTVKSMTVDEISTHIGYLFDQDYKASVSALSKSTVEFQQELQLESHKAALKYTGELNKASTDAARQVILERIKKSNKFTAMGDTGTQFQYTNDQGQVRIMNTDVPNAIDPDGLPSTVIYRIEGTGLVPVDN